MLFVKTKIGPSWIAGIGLFADQDIKKGELVWKFTPGFDQEIKAEKLLKLNTIAYQTFLNYSYRLLDSKTYVLVFDDSRFLNHADKPNLIDSDVDSSVWLGVIAARDIYRGEELTCDYKQFDADFEKRGICA